VHVELKNKDSLPSSVEDYSITLDPLPDLALEEIDGF